MPGDLQPGDLEPGDLEPGGPVVGVGTDLLDVDRLRSALGRTPGLVDRLFTAGEQDHVRRHRDPVPHLAARFAAKEAVMKSLGVGIDSVAFTDIDVVSDPGGRPSVVLSGRAATRAEEVGARIFHVSLTHTATLAQALVVACR